MSLTHWKQKLLPSNPCSYNFFQPVLPEMYRNSPVRSDSENWLRPLARATLPWGAGPQPCKWRVEQSPCTRHHGREPRRCFKTSTYVSFLSRRSGAKCSREIWSDWAVSQPTGQEDTTWDIATSYGSLPTPASLPKNEKPFPQPLHKEKPYSKQLHPLSQAEVMVKDRAVCAWALTSTVQSTAACNIQSCTTQDSL